MQDNVVGNSDGKRGWVWAAASAVLLLPAMAMQFTDEVNWSAADFMAAALLLAVPCAIWHAVTRCSGNRWYRAGVAMAALAGLFVSWVNLAVGIVGEPDNRANLWFFAVLLIGVLMTTAGRFRAIALCWAMQCMAIAQALLGVYLWLGHSATGALGLCVALMVWWWLASRLFARATRSQI